MLVLLLIFLLISNAVTLRRDKSILFSRVVIKTLFFTSFIAADNLYLKPLEKGIGLYGGLFNMSVFTQAFNIFLFIISGLILILTAFYPRKVYVKSFSSFYTLLNFAFTYNKKLISNKTGEQFRIIEYSLIIVFIITGAAFLMNAADLISVFLCIELQSYGLYILSTLYRDSESATASGLTYFLLGGLSSCFILLGSGLIYANCGTTSMDNIYIIYAISEWIGYFMFDPFYLDLGLTIMLVGFLFKISAAPFHFWSPDVYDGIPTIVTTYVAIIAKLSIFVLFFDISVNTEWRYENSFKLIFFLSSFLSLIVGSVLGLTQSRIKRLFAYSTISHVGFILLALSIDSKESMQSFIFYILQYTISNLNAFMILLCIGFSLYIYVYKKNEQEDKGLIDRNNSPIQLINQIKGYFYLNSFIAISFGITIFSFIGIPPLAGFFAKQMILSAALDARYYLLPLIAIITSVIGAAYYLNLVKEVFFYKENYKINSSIEKLSLTGYIKKNSLAAKYKKLNQQLVTFTPNDITLNSGLSITISIATLLLTFFIYIPGEWFNIVSILSSLASWKF